MFFAFLSCVGAVFLCLSIIPYLLWHFYVSFSPPQDLKRRYSAKWALVTGASSGIGKALAFKCAEQGLQVVLVAKPERLLDDTAEELQSAFPELSFVKVPVDLGKQGYVDIVAAAIKDIHVQVCFLNAGYIQTGLFDRTPLGKLYANLECNVGHVVGLSHLLINRMKAQSSKIKTGGCIVLTSSAAAVMPAPFAALYNSTKAFLSAFGSSLAAEVNPSKIDVMVFHPSPVASRFASSADHKIDIMDFFNLFAVPPSRLPDAMFAAVGRCIWRDFGMIAIIFRMMSKVLDFNFLAWVTAATIHTTPDFKRYAKDLITPWLQLALRECDRGIESNQFFEGF